MILLNGGCDVTWTALQLHFASTKQLQLSVRPAFHYYKLAYADQILISRSLLESTNHVQFRLMREYLGHCFARTPQCFPLFVDKNNFKLFWAQDTLNFPLMVLGYTSEKFRSCNGIGMRVRRGMCINMVGNPLENAVWKTRKEMV
jgi:hypothetical protein